MKMIFRNDDVGYTPVNDIGVFETLDRGVATACDVMLESPGTEKALERLRGYPWIYIGWHAHFWHSPVLPAGEVPSLVIPETGRFRHDLHSAGDIDPEELLAECRAQMDRCVQILGKAPDTCEGDDPNSSVFNRILHQVCHEYGIAIGFAHRIDKTPPRRPQPQWADRKIYILDPGPAYAGLWTDSVTELLAYDPVSYYTENKFGMEQFPEDAVLEQAWHPGYLDYHMYRDGDFGPRARFVTTSRVVDVHALCSEELKNWIKEKGIELVNFRDALYGTRDYQNHLRDIGSDLYMGSR